MRHFRRPLSITLASALVLHAFAGSIAFAAEADTDGDGITDILEDSNSNNFVDPGETNPYKADTDGGGEADGSEVRAGRNPLDKMDDLSFDADGDGWVNSIELIHGTDPKKADTDGDGTVDALDPFPLDPRYAKDANANNLPDEWEEQTKLSTTANVDTAAKGDADGDGLTNMDEFARGLNPLDADTDRDGLNDYDELKQQADPKENACLSYGTFDEPFPDMKGHWAEQFVYRLRQTTILPGQTPVIRGYVGTENKLASFAPDKPVTRFEFLKMILLSTCTKLRDTTIDVTVRFTDVPSIPTQLVEDEDRALRRRVVYTAVQYGIVKGYTNGTFQPDAPITRAEALKMLVLAAQLPQNEESATQQLTLTDVKEKDWFAPYVKLSLWYGILGGYDDKTFKPDRHVSRAEAAKLVYKTMLVNPYINGYVLPGSETSGSSSSASSGYDDSASTGEFFYTLPCISCKASMNFGKSSTSKMIVVF